MTVLVSVVMTSYNHERYVSEAIRSVLNQSFRDLELIIVDDGSKDRSAEIIAGFQAGDSRVRAVFHKQNMGVTQTFVDGIVQSKGKFISFIGSDDVWVLSKLEKQLAVLSKNEDLIVWAEADIIDGNGVSRRQTITQLLNVSSSAKSGDLFESLLREDFMFGQTMLFKREFIRSLSFDKHLKYASDHQFFVDLAKGHFFYFISEPLAKYRIHGKNISLIHNVNWYKDRILVRDYFLKQYGGEISSRAKADLYCKIGHAFLGLDKKMIAKEFFMKAFWIYPFHFESLHYLINALTDGEGVMFVIFKFSYDAIDYRLNKLLDRHRL